MSESIKTAEQDLAIITCSMASDREFFSLLVDSMEQYVDSEIMHYVIVPKADVMSFKEFEGARRQVISQEEILSTQLYSLSPLTRWASVVVPSLRRPLYITRNGSFVRGWIVQQYLKIEMARRCSAAAIMHVDSDAFFVRKFCAENAFIDGKALYFRVSGVPENSKHHEWAQVANDLLGSKVVKGADFHYIENCIVWNTEIIREMIARIEEGNGEKIEDLILAQRSFSEYYLYGIYLDYCVGRERVSVCDKSLCISQWPGKEISKKNIKNNLDSGGGNFFAVAFQSTESLSIEDRRFIYDYLTS
jgi:hypothetical protein